MKPGILKPKETRAFIVFTLMTFCIFELLKISKNFFIRLMFEGSENPLFSIIYTKNYGGAFSLWQGGRLFFILTSIFVVAGICLYVYKRVAFENKFEIISLALFVSGALGNLFERVEKGYVIDYIKLNFVEFPVFNIYDVSICTGVFLFAVYFIVKSLKEKLSNHGK